jgi:CBS domain-containing protein
MTRDVQIASPDETIREAARCMAEIDAGVLPVGENDRLVGMITDRDIAVRGVADGKGCDAKVGEVMSREVRYCFEDEDSEAVLRNMGELQLRRLPVLNRDKRLVGILSLSDCTADGREARAGEALHDITRPGGLHTQSLQ